MRILCGHLFVDFQYGVGLKQIVLFDDRGGPFLPFVSR